MRTFITRRAAPLLLGAIGILGAGGAYAQSTVTASGVIDTGLSYATNTGNGTQTKIGNCDSILGVSNIGFRGQEDLGGGRVGNIACLVDGDGATESLMSANSTAVGGGYANQHQSAMALGIRHTF